MSRSEVVGNLGKESARHSSSAHTPSMNRKVVLDYSQGLIASSIDETLSQLGNESKAALLFHLEARFHISQEEFASEPEALGRAFAGLLGSGANALERMLVQRLESFATDSRMPEEFAVIMMMATRSELSTHDARRGAAQVAGCN